MDLNVAYHRIVMVLGQMVDGVEAQVNSMKWIYTKLLSEYANHLNHYSSSLYFCKMKKMMVLNQIVVY